ncbi:MAG: FAD-dependent oxidoreductase [Erysipelotrichales bacterium]|nr:FAD-dependent oxidoreductase [Erysipelotrichales bacterium]
MKKLFTPISIGNITLKNRLIMAPMENGMAGLGTGDVTDRICEFFKERARHGVSMIMPGSIGVSPEGRGLPTQLSMWEDRHIAEHKKLVDAVHSEGALIGAQIYHAGRQASEAITGLTPLAPSAIPCGLLGNHPKEITHEEMEEVKQKCVRAAEISIAAGYDLVEVHFAHGYLLHSFMSTHTNKRTDEYGGSFDNRVKYPLEVLKAVIDVCKGKVPVQIRVSVDEYVEDGMHFDEVKEVCRRSEELGVDSISLSAGCYDAVEYAIQPMFVPQGFIIPFAEEMKKTVNVPVIVAARLNNADLVESVVEEEKADIVAIGRGLIADPLFIEKIQNDDKENIRYCIACNQGCIDRVLGGMPAHCMVNPVAGEEADRKLKPAAENKTVAVVGGGPAGMQAALTAAERGFKVNLYTNDGLKGKMETVATPPEKDSFLIFENYLKDQIAKKGVNVIEKNVETAEDVEGDTVILATGSEQAIPPIKGVNGANVVLAEDVLNGVKTGDKVVVIGGGLVGTETCKYLGSKGVSCTLVEMLDSIANGIGATFVGHMFAKLAEYGVTVKTGVKVSEITENSVELEGESLPCDTVVISTGYRSVNSLKEVLEKRYPVYVIGDANKPRRILDATEEAYLTVNNL